jgi:hypothetical protein
MKPRHSSFYSGCLAQLCQQWRRVPALSLQEDDLIYAKDLDFAAVTGRETLWSSASSSQNSRLRNIAGTVNQGGHCQSVLFLLTYSDRFQHRLDLGRLPGSRMA